MPRFPVHTVDDSPADARADLEAMQAAMGKVLNIHGGMAHSPVVLAAYRGMGRAITEHGTYDGRTREAVALAVAGVDKCAYCQSAHTVGGTRAGLSEEDTLVIRHGKPTGDDRLDSLLALAREITGDVGHVQDATWQQALDAGWSVEELEELYAHVAVNLYTNYFNHFAGTELDVPEAPELESTT